MAEAQRGQDELGGHVGNGHNASERHPPTEKPQRGSGRSEGRDVPPPEPIDQHKRHPGDPWMGGG